MHKTITASHTAKGWKSQTYLVQSGVHHVEEPYHVLGSIRDLDENEAGWDFLGGHPLLALEEGLVECKWLKTQSNLSL